MVSVVLYAQVLTTIYFICLQLYFNYLRPTWKAASATKLSLSRLATYLRIPYTYLSLISDINNCLKKREYFPIVNYVK